MFQLKLDSLFLQLRSEDKMTLQNATRHLPYPVFPTFLLRCRRKPDYSRGRKSILPHSPFHLPSLFIFFFFLFFISQHQAMLCARWKRTQGWAKQTQTFQFCNIHTHECKTENVERRLKEKGSREVCSQETCLSDRSGKASLRKPLLSWDLKKE